MPCKRLRIGKRQAGALRSRDAERHQLHVFRHVDQHRPGPARRGDVDGAADHGRDLAGHARLAIPLGHRSRHAERIALLERIGADHRGRDLAADAQHGDRIAHRVEQAGDGVADAWAATSCWTRTKKLETQGVITRYTVDLHPAKLGYKDCVIVQLTLESHTDETLYEFGRVLATIPEVQEAYLVSGDYDYYIRIAVRDTRDYERLLREKLYEIPGIRHSKSSFVLRVLKEVSVPLG